MVVTLQPSDSSDPKRVPVVDANGRPTTRTLHLRAFGALVPNLLNWSPIAVSAALPAVAIPKLLRVSVFKDMIPDLTWSKLLGSPQATLLDAVVQLGVNKTSIVDALACRRSADGSHVTCLLKVKPDTAAVLLELSGKNGVLVKTTENSDLESHGFANLRTNPLWSTFSALIPWFAKKPPVGGLPFPPPDRLVYCYPKIAFLALGECMGCLPIVHLTMCVVG